MRQIFSLNDEQNLAFINDPRRVAAETKMHDIVKRIQSDIKTDGNASYYLTVLPPLLNSLQEAWDNLITIEATVEAELLDRSRWHG